jgi:hypothetical protein
MELNYKFTNLCNWISENGGFVNSSLSIDYSTSYGKFIKSNSKLSIGDELFSIPDNLLLNKSNVGLDINSGSEKIDTTISLLYELKKEESFWEPYFNILPDISDFKEHPLFLYKNGKIKNLSNFSNYELSSVYNEFIYLNKYLNEIKIFDVIFGDEVFWAFLIVITRMWQNSGLVPMADLFQHSYDSNITLFKESNLNKMKSDRDFNDGEIIYDNYMVKSDTTLFFNFGFLQNTRHTYTTISIDYNNCNKDEKEFINTQFEIVEDSKEYLKKEFEFDTYEHIFIVVMNFDKNMIKNNIDFDESKKWSILKNWISDYKDLYHTDSNIRMDYFNSKVEKLTEKLTKSYNNCILLIDKNLSVLSK